MFKLKFLIQLQFHISKYYYLFLDETRENFIWKFMKTLQFITLKFTKKQLFSLIVEPIIINY